MHRFMTFNGGDIPSAIEFTNADSILNEPFFCGGCPFESLKETQKIVLLTAMMHFFFYFAFCLTIIYVSLIIYSVNSPLSRFNACKSALIFFSFMFSIIGYCFSAFTSALIREVPELFDFYTLSIMFGIIEVMIYGYWIISMTSNAKTDWDIESFIDIDDDGADFV